MHRVHKIILSGFRKSLLCYQSWGPYRHFKDLLNHYPTYYDSKHSRHKRAGMDGFPEILSFNVNFFNFQNLFPGPWLKNIKLCYPMRQNYRDNIFQWRNKNHNFETFRFKVEMLKSSQIRICPEKPCALRKTFVQVFIQITMCLQRLMFSSWNVSSIINVYKFYHHVCF